MHSACLTSTHMFPFITTYLFPSRLSSSSSQHLIVTSGTWRKTQRGETILSIPLRNYFNKLENKGSLKPSILPYNASQISLFPFPPLPLSCTNTAQFIIIFPVTNNTLTYQTPVFSVHGNHDNPSGLGNLCALDVLSEAGLINHFGKALSHESVEMCPVLIRKGMTKVALYGLGSITDKALHGMFEKGKVSMSEPPVDVQSWFSMFVIHQNRAYRGDKEYIPESFLDEKLKVKLDLVIWGHEHDCQLDPVWYKKRFRIIQPGSTIATSIVKGETKQKHMAVLEIKGRYMKCTKIPLTTVRPMYIKNLALKFAEHRLDPGDVDIESKVEEFCAEQINKMVEAVTRDNASFPKRPLLPLIKLRVDVSGGYPTFNKRRFAQQFVNKVANVRVHGHDEQNLIDFKDKDERKKTGERSAVIYPFVCMGVCMSLKQGSRNTDREEGLHRKRSKMFWPKRKKGQQLKVLSANGLTELLREFVKNDTNAHPQLVDIVLAKAADHLKHTDDEKLLEEEFKKFRKARQDMQEAEVDTEVKMAPLVFK
ncbi:putative double-strand break repair protein MRE11A [Apostichopus japonicus]|uniref:Putative double-strand break repair protein MRE11A n=1 Tax=Stichopus japonicus TaxID=307972 RepID=A0A2G8JLD4_STIJA|nr:putative double-strand break repair protein MRE11A [Apostichopus japonicus]